MKSFYKKIVFIFCISLLIVLVFVFLLQKYLLTENNSIKKVFSKHKYSQNYVSGVIPHHLLAKSIIEKFFAELSKENYPQKIVLFGPDHFNAGAIYGNKLITINTSTTNLGNLAIDNELLNTLARVSSFAFSNYAIKNEHAIMSILPFIRQYFPNAKIIPFLIPAKFSFDETKNVVENLNKILPDNSFILASVDWSHNLPQNVADFHDKKSIRVFLNFEEKNFSNIEVDCPQCLYAIRYFAKLRNADNYIEIDHKNSQDFLNGEIIDNTTSYFSVLFSKRKTIYEISKYPKKTILFLGNIILDKEVKRLLDKNGLLYPIENIRNFLRGIDIVIGNLEGFEFVSPNYTSDSPMRFNFIPGVLNLLRYAKINFVSLANDSTLAKDKDVLVQIKELLNRKNINYFGDPISCGEENIYKIDNIVLIGLNLIGLNKNFSINCTQEQIVKLVKNVKQENPNDFVIVFIHWGEKYRQTSNVTQKELAHLMIDSGADLVIGSHPYFVQEIEQYKGKLIFYSLGNFISDQYFSKETQEGLAVGLELYDNKALIHLFPLGINKNQPYLLDNMKRIKFLENLSLKSSSALKNQILNGIITIDIP